MNKYKQKRVDWLIYLSFWGWARGSFFCLSINDGFQGPFFKLKHRENIYIPPGTSIDTNSNTLPLWTLSLTFNLFSWSCSMTLILRRVSSSFFNSCRRLCIFTGTAAVRPFLNTEREEEISGEGHSVRLYADYKGVNWVATFAKMSLHYNSCWTVFTKLTEKPCRYVSANWLVEYDGGCLLVCSFNLLHLFRFNWITWQFNNSAYQLPATVVD